jgi:hypothetical protein
MDTLPTPKNDAVDIKEIPGKRFVVIRFSGMADEEMLAEQTTALNSFIKEKGLEPLSPPAYAFFNPPWTLPPLRRNEVMVEVAGR